MEKKTRKAASRKKAQIPGESNDRSPFLRDKELRALLSLRHPDPHQMLGPHLTGDGLVIRAFRPDATQIEVTIGKRAHEMQRTHDAGVFETFVPEISSVPAYRFRIRTHEDQTITIRDPYAFMPTIGELDLHLFGEGRHEEIYNKLGAHVLSVNRVPGVSFAVWAPQASGVSVVGDFNGWDGRFHQMRSLGASGVWEVFVPELAGGALYKFEIRRPKGLPFLKADPYAQYTEVPPNTSSIVYESKYKFRDSRWLKQRSGRQHFRQPLSIYEVH